MGSKIGLMGNSAIAYAMRQIEPDVCAAYPITPSTQVMEEFSQYVANGIVRTELIPVESEHSAMSACIGAAAAGGRVITASSANGIALMWEMLYVASGLRLPIMLCCVNRALSGPLNIHNDHSDSMGCRDSGWIQIYSENAQECYDNMLQALRIAEHPDVLLPVMCCVDGFIISHSYENLEVLSDDEVKEFIGEYTPANPLLNIDSPVTYGPNDPPAYYIEHKRQQVEAMARAKSVILAVGREFGLKFGRSYGFFEEYRLDGAEMAMVVPSSTAGTAKEAVDNLRAQGIKAGLIKPRVFRPFPYIEYAEALEGLKAVVVMDRSDSFGAFGGPLFTEIRSALYDAQDKPIIINKVFGLGGRDITVGNLEEIFSELNFIARTGKTGAVVEYYGVRD